jgi:hypothetical protein
LYEGRTRGKRIKYTYSDDEDEPFSDAPTRRSNRNTGTHTPAEPAAPTVTQSGRQVRSRHGGLYGESMLSGTTASTIVAGGYDGAIDEQSDNGSTNRRPRRAAISSRLSRGGSHIEGYNSVDEMEDEEDASEDDYGDDEDEDQVSIASDRDESDDPTDEDEDMDDDLINEHQKKVLVFKLPIKTPSPERKITLKLNLSAEKSTEPVAPINGIDGNAKLACDQIPGTPTKNSGFIEPMNIGQQSENARNHLAPHSPSLAYRGSPEKAHAFSTTINVGQRGA